MFDQVSWLAVVAATVAAFVLQALWYGPLFGKQWARLSGVDPDMGGGPPLRVILAANFVVTLLGATALAVLVTPFARDVVTAGFVGVLVFAVSGLALKLNDMLFGRLKAGLFYIDAIGHLLSLVLMAVIVGVFRV